MVGLRARYDGTPPNHLGANVNHVRTDDEDMHDHPRSGDIVPTMCTYSPLKNRFEVEIMGLMLTDKDDDCRVMS